MPTSYRARHLQIARRLEVELTGLFADLSARAQRAILRHADADGNVPRAATVEIQQEIDRAVVALFLGRNGRGELAPFDVLPNGHLIALSPYMRALWQAIRDGVRNQVAREAALMRRRLPPDIVATLLQARRAPFQRGTVAEVFRPNPLAKYDAPHTWVDPAGYRLSDRVWNTSQATRRRLDMYLDEAIREGRGAAAMARELEQFLVPGRELLRTNRPYGRDASYDAMRLARTEIARAAGQAAEQSARQNPLVAGLKWNRSPQGQACDICDPLAQGGPNGDGVYPLDEAPTLPGHPNCVTPGQLVATDRGRVPIEEIVAGDYVLSHTGAYRRVMAAWSTPHDGLVYAIDTGVRPFELTGNHPVYIVQFGGFKPDDSAARGVVRSTPHFPERVEGYRWINAEDLRVGDVVQYQSNDHTSVRIHIRSIATRHYAGPVYNMTVDRDESYTVNGAVVHNCMCYYTQELLPAAELEAQFEALRRDIQSARADLILFIGPLLVDQFTELLLGRAFDVLGAQPSLAGVLA